MEQRGEAEGRIDWDGRRLFGAEVGGEEADVVGLHPLLRSAQELFGVVDGDDLVEVGGQKRRGATGAAAEVASRLIAPTEFLDGRGQRAVGFAAADFEDAVGEVFGEPVPVLLVHS